MRAGGDRLGGPVDFIDAQATCVVAVVSGHRNHGNIAAVALPVHEVVAARTEVAAPRTFVGQGEVPRNGDQRARVLVGARQRDRPEQRLRIGVLHLVEDIDDGPGLDRLAGIHHAKPVADLQHEAEVVADEQHRGAVFLAKILDQIDHRRLDRHIERRRRFVEDEKRGLRHQRHGDDDALLLPAGQLVREGAHDPFRVGQAHVGHDLERALVGFFLADALVDHRHFHQLLADAHGGVQRGHRFLIDHRDLGAADVAQFLFGHGRQVAALELDRSPDDAAVLAKIAHDRQRHGGLAAAGFAHQSHRLAGLDHAGEIHHRGDFPKPGEEADRKVLDLEDRAIIVPFGHLSSPVRGRRGRCPRTPEVFVAR